jgi:hypothetical protein
MATDDELPFKVEQWDRDGRIERVIASAAACPQYPQARLTLRQGIRVIEETGG